ncbi:RCC1/BLIP-II [Atractiella rhizophila]|nr:RCC1/BLIP-II [Atractiella rhizophila]
MNKPKPVYSIHHVLIQPDLQAFKKHLRTISHSVASKKSTSSLASSLPRSPPIASAAKTSVSPLGARDAVGRTVLHVLAVWSDEELALEFLHLLGDEQLVKRSELRLLLDAQDLESGWTALHRALYSGNLRIVKLLDYWGADAGVKDREGLTAYDLWNHTIRGTIPVDDAEDEKEEGRRDLFMWGANRNYVLGLGGDKDRVVPEAVTLMPGREEGKRSGRKKFQSVSIVQVAMARMHTVLITNQQSFNTYICGYTTPSQGRLSTFTQPVLHFSPLSFAHRVVAVSVAVDHTVLLTSTGAVYTFGSNKQSQLGYKLEGEGDIQVEPRKVVGVLRKEEVVGVAAGNAHTVAWTKDECWSWGSNKGQLGYGTTGPQILPRKLAGVTETIQDVKVTEYATAVLLDSGVIYVFHAGQQVRVNFPHRVTSSTAQHYFPPQRTSVPKMRKISSCGTTFACLSTDGEVFRFSLEPPVQGAVPLPPSSVLPKRVWALRSRFSAAYDVAVGLDGQLLMCTASGQVFMMKDRGNGWKWNRVHGLQRIVQVGGNSTGAWSAIRRLGRLDGIEVENADWGEELWEGLEWVKAKKEQERGVGEGDAEL